MWQQGRQGRQGRCSREAPSDPSKDTQTEIRSHLLVSSRLVPSPITSCHCLAKLSCTSNIVWETTHHHHLCSAIFFLFPSCVRFTARDTPVPVPALVRLRTPPWEHSGWPLPAATSPLAPNTRNTSTPSLSPSASPPSPSKPSSSAASIRMTRVSSVELSPTVLDPVHALPPALSAAGASGTYLVL